MLNAVDRFDIETAHQSATERIGGAYWVCDAYTVPELRPSHKSGPYSASNRQDIAVPSLQGTGNRISSCRKGTWAIDLVSMFLR